MCCSMLLCHVTLGTWKLIHGLIQTAGMFVQSPVCKFKCMCVSYGKFFAIPWLTPEFHKELCIFHAVSVAAAVLKTSPKWGCMWPRYLLWSGRFKQACSCLLVWVLISLKQVQWFFQNETLISAVEIGSLNSSYNLWIAFLRCRGRHHLLYSSTPTQMPCKLFWIWALFPNPSVYKSWIYLPFPQIAFLR